MLQRYRRWNILPMEVWSDASVGDPPGNWEACQGETLPAEDGPFEVLAIINGTSTQSPVIEWWLSADADCAGGKKYSVGTRTPTISSNTPYPVTPSGGYAINSHVPPGDYYLCAKIDSTDSISETDNNDNGIRSELLFEVKSCP